MLGAEASRPMKKWLLRLKRLLKKRWMLLSKTKMIPRIVSWQLKVLLTSLTYWKVGWLSSFRTR